MNQVPDEFVISTAEILAVGTELLLGQTVNTNASVLGQYMSELGINVYHSSVVGDNRARLAGALRQASERADLVLISGGLGPTDDDITMQVAAETAGVPLALDNDAWQTIRSYFSERGLQTTTNNRKQAMLPVGQTVLANRNGTAPGARIYFRNGSGRAVFFILLPGPPAELAAMFEHEVRPWLLQHTDARFAHRYVRLVGIGESAAEALIEDLIHNQHDVTIAPYASVGHVALRVSLRLGRNDAGEDALDRVIGELYQRLGRYIYEVGDRDLSAVILDLLADNNLRVAAAESITGGRVAAELTRHAGSAAAFAGGIVCYSNESKVRDLGVDAHVIDTQGAVSEAVARQMAEGVMARFGTDLGISVTGLAGPGRGEESAEVGTCYIGVARRNQDTLVHYYKGAGGRETITQRTVIQVLMRLWEVLR